MTIKTAENSKREPELFQVHYYGRVIPVMAFTQRMAYAEVAGMYPAFKKVKIEVKKILANGDVVKAHAVTTEAINPWTGDAR